MAETVSPYLPPVTLHVLKDVPGIFLSGCDSQAFGAGTTVLSHICHCAALRGGCVGTALSATGRASSHKGEQSYQRGAVRMRGIQKNCQQNSGLNRNRNTSLLTRHFPILYVYKKSDLFISHNSLLNLFKKLSKIYSRDGNLSQLSAVSPVLCFVLFCWFWTFQKQNLEICQVSFSNHSILLSTDECLFIIPLWNNMSVHFHSYSCFTTTSTSLKVSQEKCIGNKWFYGILTVDIHSYNLQNVPVGKKKKESNSQVLLYKW